MGAWGEGLYENDQAMDCIDFCCKDDSSLRDDFDLDEAVLHAQQHDTHSDGMIATLGLFAWLYDMSIDVTDYGEEIRECIDAELSVNVLLSWDNPYLRARRIIDFMISLEQDNILNA